MKFTLTLLLCVGILSNLTACGTVLYPERKGQISGKLDVGVVILDAIGLLFFFVPGVIAFAVDFSNGTIYLPGGRSALLSSDELDSIVADGNVDVESLQMLINQKASMDVSIMSRHLQVQRLNSASELPAS